ncbi:MAG: hypothetical protein JO035_01065 [Betaproteobacteria bacterium]|nr:hypothetical protein [Betaproteobacteria bacterium]
MAALKKLLAALVAASLLAGPAWPQGSAPAPQKGAPAQPPQAAPASAADSQEDDVEPKFIWGILIKIAVDKLSGYAFQAFTKWALNRLTGGTSGFTLSSAIDLARDSGARIVQSLRGRTEVAARDASLAPPIVVGDPDKPLVADGKKENYQGVHMAIMVAEDGGKRFTFRPVNEGFRTGERFKLRILSTFGGELTIENVNPRGERRQIFPAAVGDVVALQPASETLVPLEANQFFEFTGNTGKEQLVITVVDPRAVGNAASRANVFRQDTQFGSNFLQEAVDGTYPTIQQAVELVHSAK